jgi:hypothetical protein
VLSSQIILLLIGEGDFLHIAVRFKLILKLGFVIDGLITTKLVVMAACIFWLVIHLHFVLLVFLDVLGLGVFVCYKIGRVLD